MPYHYLNSFYGNAPLSYPNFFNGRILTASDLLNERAATLQTQQLLGQAIGEGVVTGLYVSKKSASLNIAANAIQISVGLAIAPSGTPLHLTSNVTIPLSDANPPDLQALERENAKKKRLTVFSSTTPPVGLNLIGTTNTGYYLLAITPDSRYSTEVAPHSGLGGSDPTVGQGRVSDAHINDRQEHGVRFKLIPLASQELLLSGDSKKWRSHIAHRAFGTYVLEPSASRPHTLNASYGLVDHLRAQNSPDLGADDLPLAIVSFRNAQVEWVDGWMVRRPCLPSQKPDLYLGGYESGFAEIYPHLTGIRRQVEAQAFFLQFQTQLEELRFDRSPNTPNPHTIAASQYFDYLPAAGYLRVHDEDLETSPGSFISLFGANQFFGRAIEIRAIEAPFVRTIFERALHVEPINTSGEMPVDLYEVKDSSSDSDTHYLIFARHEPITVAPPKEETPPPVVVEVPEEAFGNLFVTVMDEAGVAYSSIYDGITVTATNQSTSQTFTGTVEYLWNLESREGLTYLGELSTKGRYLRKKYGYGEAEYAGVLIRRPKGDSPTTTDVPILYAFRDLPVGDYTVLAAHSIPYTPGISTPATVTKATDTRITATLAALIVIYDPPYQPPVTYDPCAPIHLPRGISIEETAVNPKWRHYVSDAIIIDKVKTTPPIDVWEQVVISDCYKIKLEKYLQNPDDPIPDPRYDPRVVIEDPRLYIRKDYDPTTQPAEVQAFVQTQDGTRFPVVVVATDNALKQATTVNRAEIAEYDTATYNQLAKVGLTNMEVVAATPPQIIAGSLGLTNSSAKELVTVTRSRLENDFQKGFMGYPGVTKAINDALVASLAPKNADGSLNLVPAVELANARPNAIASAIAQAVPNANVEETTRYAARFQADVRQSLPAESYDLRAIGLTDTQVTALNGQGIQSVGELYANRAVVDAAGNVAGGELLLAAFDNVPAAVNSAVIAAAKGKAQGEYVAVPQVSIAKVAGMTPELASELTSQQIYTARQLANADKSAIVAAITEANPGTTLTIETLDPLVETSKNFSYGYTTLVQGLASVAGIAPETAAATLATDHSSIGSITEHAGEVMELLQLNDTTFSTGSGLTETLTDTFDFKANAHEFGIRSAITDMVASGVVSAEPFRGGVINAGEFVLLNPGGSGDLIIRDVHNTGMLNIGSLNVSGSSFNRRLLGGGGRFGGGGD